MMFTKEELIKSANAQILQDNIENKEFSISTDSRTVNVNDIFLPLKGESFDGENFITDVVKKGCKAYFTTKDIVEADADLVLKVEDTKEAYLSIAKYFRNKINPKTICVTGSSGKTTTKEMLFSVLSQKFRTHKTFSNHNNEIGFCQTVLSMPADTEVLIVEAGMRGIGEIDLISRNLSPDYGFVTNCGTAHLGRLGSVENIAKAKCEIVNGMNNNGCFIAKDQKITRNVLDFEGKKIFYSLDNVKILEQKQKYSKFEYKGVIYELSVEGIYNIENSLGVIELAQDLGLSENQIKTGLKEFKTIEKRWETENINGLNFINDSYNANPDSMKSSVETFISIYKNPVVVLGDMGELGDDEIYYHRQVGEYLSKLNRNVKYLCVGKLAAEIGNVLLDNGCSVEKFSENEEIAKYIVENFDENSTIFLKASRFMKFEEIMDYVKRGTCKL